MNFGDRRDSHYSLLRNNSHWNPYLQNAWNRYGEDNFDFVVIHELMDDEDINELERHYIKYYRNMNLSYNIADGGEGGGNLGNHLSDETKRKIGEKNRINMTGLVMPESTKRKISEEHKQAWANYTDEEKQIRLNNLKKIQKGFKMDRNSEQYKKLVERERAKSNAAKYDIETVREIRRLHEKENMGYTEISKKLNINRNTVYNIATYRRWKYVS